ncbi:aspartate aminotransferase family protein [Methylacidiphilum caldifontis]|uniref:4-aminobutyrate aminotransferase n=1 Tax=Methylacidiphilum caldifontis TaxID=2795386 RepID=A0A4Y8PBU8_9BACT|nr:aspartate aminotransferase family protein [Methylacidiphilum caldifontis]QSR89025.1 aspartate aminotransferase family protein [Methylacidiphilum caldifontis]TFE68620.1 4-aminobutyrate aminotransferase [Methylacidiphilum caldifontis]
MEEKKHISRKQSQALSFELSQYECRNITSISAQSPIFLSKSKGIYFWDVDGNKYLDLTAGFGVAALGHRPSKVYRSVLKQLKELWHVLGDVYPSKDKIELCRLLSKITYEKWINQRGKVILGCTGSDAVEAALKTAFFYTKKEKFVAFKGAYHGLSLGTLGVNGLPYFSKPYNGLYYGCANFVPYPDCYHCPHKPKGLNHQGCGCEPFFEEKLKSAIGDRCAAILFEPIQGRGGIIEPPDWFLPLLAKVGRQNNVLLIADEIFTGLYRTAKRFGCDWSGVVPDIICLGKSMAGGFPISACIGKEDIMDSWPENGGEAIHTSTFLGHPLGCRMAIEQIKELEERNEDLHLNEKGEYFLELLKKLAKQWDCLKNPRGKGLFLGVDVVDQMGRPATDLALKITTRMLDEGILILTEGPDRNVLSFTPPLTINFKQLSWVGKTLEKVIKGILKEES